MALLHQITQKLARTFHHRRYLQAVFGILATPPITIGTMPFMLVSMVHTRDVLPYLVAVKSFVSYANPRRIAIVCDPSITDADRSVFRQHIPHVELRRAEEFAHDDIPRGGTWERLYAIAKYCNGEYIVQLDADTVTMLPPKEVIRAVHAGAGFVLSGESGTALMTMEETVAQASRHHSGDGQWHIQPLVEASMASSNLPAHGKYVRGCSGFTGFPQSTSMTADMIMFSRAMKARHGERWSEWGTEQITSNYLVANAQATTVLPFPDYGTPDVSHDESILTHFIGSMRFTSSKYRAATLKAIGQLNAPGASNAGAAVITTA